MLETASLRGLVADLGQESRSLAGFDGDDEGQPTDDKAGPLVDEDSGPLPDDDIGPAVRPPPLPAELSDESLGLGASFRFICSWRNISSSSCILNTPPPVRNFIIFSDFSGGDWGG